LILVKRYITRPPSDTEKNISITAKEFQKMKSNGEFALNWHIYGLDYGVPIEIDEWLKDGHLVVVNVSRTIVPLARQKYKNIKVVFIEVPFEVTLERIKERGRETGKRLEERIERARQNQKFPGADFIVDNSGNLDVAINQFLEYLISTINKNS
jgi:ribose 1,5-bisphosphokinase